MRHKLALGIGLTLVMAAIFWQSYGGRQQVIDSQRRQCLAFQRSFAVPLLNSIRADEEGNTAVAADPHQSEAIRRARHIEAVQQERSLVQMDSAVDLRLAHVMNADGRYLLNHFGRAIVLKLGREGRAFSCDKAYPDASHLPAIG